MFDGASFILNGDGSLAHQLPDWEEALVMTAWERGSQGWRCEPGEIHPLDPHPADIYHAMIVGLRDYVNANRFPGVVLGLSGGIDSALSAAVAVDALGADRVWCVMMPSRFTSRDASTMPPNVRGCWASGLMTVPIEPAAAAFDAMLAKSFEGRKPRSGRGEYPVAHPRRYLDGAVQQVRPHAADDRE